MKTTKLIINIIIFVGLFFLFGFIHELGHIIFGILRGDKIKSVGFMVLENGNIFTLSMVVRWDYNITTTDGFLLLFLGGYILAGIVCSITMFVGYYKNSKLLFHASWFNLLGQLSYILFDSYLGIGDMGNVYWYLETIKGIEINVLSFIIPILIGIVLFMVLVLHLTNKLHFGNENK